MHIRKLFHILIFVSFLIGTPFSPAIAIEDELLQARSHLLIKANAAAPQAPTATTIFVDANAIGAATGISWTDAYANLQDALAVAIADDEIWVAEEIYYPDEGAGQVNDVISSTFALTNGVKLYGGFAPDLGVDEFHERDWETYITVLSGDLEQNDITDPHGVVISTENIIGIPAWTVVASHNVTDTTVLDGFTITAGYAYGTCGNDLCQYGGGLYNFAGNLNLINLTFSGNYAYLGGGGMYNSYSNPVLSNISFSANMAENGGGMFNYFSNPTINDATFSGNRTDSTGDGGGMYNDNSSPVLNQVVFDSNIASDHGGGVYNFHSDVHFANLTFTENIAVSGGGGMSNEASDPILTQVTFSNNGADFGAGMFNYQSAPIISNTLFVENAAALGGGMDNFESDSSLFNVTFTGNLAAAGAGMHNIQSNTSISRTVFFSNSASVIGGGIFNENSNPFLGNTIFSKNEAANGGGGIYNLQSSPILINATIADNQSGWGGGIYNLDGSQPVITNTIIWANQAITGGAQIYSEPGSLSLIAYTDIEDSSGSGTGWDTSLGIDGGGNLDSDPLFVNPSNGDLHLLPGSQAIDAGDLGVCPTADLDGDLRPQGAGCDMGAFEFGVIFVDRDATGAATGISWTDAFTNVQDALSVAFPRSEIWLAEGIYYPDEGVGQENDVISSTFALTNGLKLYGGFAPDLGVDEFPERDWETYITLLSGDLGQNDITDPTGVLTDMFNIVGENARSVVTSINLTDTVTLDGFTITAGTAIYFRDDHHPGKNGSGLYSISSPVSLSNLRFAGNISSYFGGGIYNQGGEITLSATIFDYNIGDGAAIYNQDGDLFLDTITVTNNIAGDNGGIHNHALNSTATISITNSAFFTNTASCGGAIYNFGEGDLAIGIISNTIIADNFTNWGGGICNTSQTEGAAKLQLIKIEFFNNEADMGGAAIANGFGVDDTGLLEIEISDSVFTNNHAIGIGGAIAANTQGVDPGPSYFSIVESTFSENSSDNDAGAIFNGGTTEMLVDQSVFFANSSSVNGVGGAIHNAGYSGDNPVLTVINSTFSNNTSVQAGGAILNDSTGVGMARANLIHNTFADNTSDHRGSGISNVSFDPTLQSVITMTGNIIANSPPGEDCYNQDGSIIDGGYNLVEDGSCGFPAAGDPLLAPLADNGGETQTHALLPGSPAIDAIPSIECQVTIDQRGETREDWACDVGAFEMQFSDSDIVNKSVVSGNTYTFGPTLAKVQVLDDGDCLTGLTVQRVDENHPNATENLLTERYWDITPTGCSEGFVLSLTLPHTFSSSTHDKLCGFEDPWWNCGVETENIVVAGPAEMPDAITRLNVTHLSDWLVGNSVGPNFVSLISLSSRSDWLQEGILIGGLAFLIIGTVFLFKRRKQ